VFYWSFVDLRGHACEPHFLSMWPKVLLPRHLGIMQPAMIPDRLFHGKNGNLFTLTATSEMIFCQILKFLSQTLARCWP
jgi:hypothetical protein